MLSKFLAFGLATLALVRATPFQVNIAVSFDTAVTAAVDPGNYYLVNVGRNETLFGAGKGQPVYTNNITATPGPLGQWRVEPVAGSSEYRFFNIGLDSSTSANNGLLYVAYGPSDLSLTHIITPVQGQADTFIVRTLAYFPREPEVLIQPTKITQPRYGTWGAYKRDYWNNNYPQVLYPFLVSPQCLVVNENGKPRKVVEILTGTNVKTLELFNHLVWCRCLEPIVPFEAIKEDGFIMTHGKTEGPSTPFSKLRG
ncbi:hypothetical protein B0H19DRAFT_1323080 [Mycena capillaripes]|nr:hypothetical protein B0H19DRAFT_1323080 [Mycena capillaripes]